MFGLAYFYKYFYGHTLDNRVPSAELLRLYFHITYNIYCSILWWLSYKAVGSNISRSIMLRFTDRISDDMIRQAVESVADFLMGSDHLL